MNTNIVRFAALFLALVLGGCSQTAPMATNSAANAQITAGGYGVAAPGAYGPTFGPQTPVMVPPTNLAKLGTPHDGCETGPLAVELSNTSEQYLQLQFDGMDVTVMGPEGILPPYLAPHTVAYLCINKPGKHMVSGTYYTFRYGQPVKGNEFTWKGDFAPMVSAAGHRELRFDGLNVWIS